MDEASASQEKIKELQMLEQSLNSLLMQKQQFQLQLSEIDSALNEIKGKDKAFKIVGEVMVEMPVPDLEKDLKSKQETFNLRIKTLEKQEKDLTGKAQKLQKEVLGNTETSQ